MYRFCKKIFPACILACTVFSHAAAQTLAAQELTAVNDVIITGPLEKIREDIIRNDLIPERNYSWRIIPSSLPAVSRGKISQDGDYLVYTPNAAARNTSFDIKYELSCGDMKSTATIHITVQNYNNPVNVVPSDVECISEMPEGVDFSPVLKYVGKSVDNPYENVDRLDGFSMPLVGDLNGDGKPEIVVMGIDDGEWLGATGNKIIILNGQTGAELFRYDLINLKGQYRLRSDPRHNSISKMAIADLDRNGTVDIIVTETGRDGRVYCIEPVFSGSQIVGMTQKWTGWQGSPTSVASYKDPIKDDRIYSSPVPYIADINGDGTPEVIVYNKIYDGVSGELVCTLETLNNFSFDDAKSKLSEVRSYAYVGRRPGARWIDGHIPCMVIADINGDGILDIVAGSKVYIMKDDRGKPALDRIIYGPSSITALRGKNSREVEMVTTNVTDGFTAVADIDLDGKLDVIVLSPATNNMDQHTQNLLYVWDPMKNPATPKAALYLYSDSYSGTVSHPFIGDINGRLDDYSGKKRLPEICFNAGRVYVSGDKTSPIAFHPQSHDDLTRGGLMNSSQKGHGFNYGQNKEGVLGHIIAFTYHADPKAPLHERLKMSWAMEHGDASSCTGITMFDFDNDNIKELCYKDENSLRVIAPAMKTYINYDEPESKHGAIRFKYSDNIGSFTGFEAPVIADVNMDGSADIVIMAHNDPKREHSKSFVHVFEHAPGTSMWAPCPPVWNQAFYFPLQINENLTVPAKTQPMLTSYKDSWGNTIYPYNGQWIQQPIVKKDEKYIPQVRKPDAILQEMTVTVISSSTTNVSLYIRNGGSASINAQTPIAFYDGDVTGKTIEGGARLIGRAQPVGVDIFPGEKMTLTYRLSGNFNNHLIWARIVDDGRRFPATGYAECDPSNNILSGIHCPYLKYTVTASPDRVICGNTETLLTAVPVNAQQYPPKYQWYRNDTLIQGATSKTHLTRTPGKYKCHVVEDICRGFSDSKTVEYRIDPDAFISGPAKFKYFGTEDSLVITLPVTNGGLSAMKSPFCISAYSNNATPASNMAVGNYSSIALGAGKTVYISLIIRKLSTYSPLDNIVVRVNDKGNATWFQPECEYANNTAVYSLNSLLLAHDDRASAIAGTAVKIDILANDAIPEKCTSPTLEILNPSGTNGSASFVQNLMQYTADAGFTGVDCVDCRISCDGDMAYSKAYIAVDRPLSEKYAACPNTPVTVGFVAAAGLQHFWYSAEKGGNPIKNTASDVLEIIKDGSALQTVWAEPRQGDAAFPRHRVDVELIPAVIPGTAGPDQALCGNVLPAPLSSTPSTGGTAAHAYQWQVFSGTAWTDIAGATELTYSPPATSQATRYRLKTTAGTSPCETAYSNEAVISVMPVATASNIVANSKRVCYGKSAELSASGNIQSPEYRWYDSQLATANLLHIGAEYTTLPVISETKYYVAVSGTGYCENLPGERKEVSVDVVKTDAMPDIRIDICPMPDRSVNLTSFIDSLDYFSVKWTKLNSAAPDIVDAKKGKIDTRRLIPGATYKYRYSLTSECGSISAIAYIHTMNNRTLHRIDTIVTCRTNETSHSIHLNQLMGLELNGEWKYDNTVNPDNTVKSNVRGFPQSSNYCGALMFDAYQAWADATDAGYAISYRGNANAKKFRFQYSAPNSCIGNRIQTLVIIITDN
jgi:hypothetical protein